MSDDHIALRDGLARMLDQTGEFKVTGTAANGKDTKAAFESGVQADVLILDINMPGMDGYETAEWMKQNKPAVNILVYSMYNTQVSLIRLLQMGIKGVLKKDTSVETLYEAIRTVADGNHYYGEKASGTLAAFFEKDENGISAMDRGAVTEEEIAFIKLAATDMTYKEIADKMGLTLSKCEVLRSNLFEKLQVTSRVGLAIEGVKSGIVKF